jgi:rhodanese-related sulfurtransferase
MSFLQNWVWMLLKRLLKLQFPDVKHISTATLADWLEQEQLQTTKRSPPLRLVILDARAPEEYFTSHIQTAQLVPTEEIELLSYLPLSNQIVTYCSIGYRSALLAQKLQQKGYTQVFNLEGSIFQWTNEGRSLYRCDQIATQVHPYNKFWKILLNPPRI